MGYSDDELQKMIDGASVPKHSDADLQKMIDATPAPKPKAQPKSFGEQVAGGVEATKGFLGNMAEGAAKGFEDVDRAMLSLSPSTKLTSKENARPIELAPEVHFAYKNPIERHQKEHPISASIAQGVGEQVPYLPAFETGAGIAGGALKLGAKGLSAAGPMGAALLQTASKMPGALQAIAKLTFTGSGGSLVQGMEQSLAKQARGGQGKPPNLVQAFEDGVKEMEKNAPVIAGLGAGGQLIHAAPEIAKHIAPKLKLMNKMAENEAAAAHKAALAEQEINHKQYLQDIERQWDAHNAVTDEQTQKADMDKMLAQKNYQRGVDQDFKHPTFNKARDLIVQEQVSGKLLPEEATAKIRKLEELHYRHEQEMAAAKAEDKAAQAAKTKAASEGMKASERAGAGESRAMALQKEHDAAAAKLAEELAQEKPGSVADARDIANSQREGDVGRAAYFNLQHEAGVKRGVNELSQEPQGSVSNARDITTAEERSGIGAQRAASENAQRDMAIHANADELARYESDANAMRAQSENQSELDRQQQVANKNPIDELPRPIVAPTKADAKAVGEAEKRALSFVKQTPKVDPSAPDESPTRLTVTKEEAPVASPPAGKSENFEQPADVKEGPPSDVNHPYWGTPVSKESTLHHATYDDNPYASPRYRSRGIAGYKQPQSVGHPGDTPADIELKKRALEQKALDEGKTTEDAIDSAREKRGTLKFTDDDLRESASRGALAKALVEKHALSTEQASSAANALTDLGMNGAAAMRWFGEKLGQLKSYDQVMHVMGVQKDTDIFSQYAPDLQDAYQAAGKSLANLGSLTEQFSKTRGKLSFAQMGAGKISPEIIQQGVRGRYDFTSKAWKDLTPAERQARLKEWDSFSPEVKRAISESRKAVQDYLKKVEPVADWLNENAKDLPEDSGLGRLRRTLNGHIEDMGGGVPRTQGGLAKAVQGGGNRLMSWMFVGKAANSVIHAAEKGVALGAREGPVALAGAIAKAHLPGAYRDFANDFLNAAGPITESFEEQGIKMPQSKLGRAATGYYFEQAPNRVATVLGLDKAAKELGFDSGESLAKQLVDARNGKGPLAYDTEKVVEATRRVQDYVSDITGLNVPGMRDRNIFQRSTGQSLGNLFLGMPTVQARNLHRIFQDIGSGKLQGVKAATTVGGYLIGSALVAGTAMPKDVEGPLRDTMGAPNWYHVMDAAHAARHAVHADELPTIPHLQQSLAPIAGGGANFYQMARDTLKQGYEGAKGAMEGDLDAKKLQAAATILGVALGKTAFLGLGGGVISRYQNAYNEGQKGYKDMHVYERGFFGNEQKVADVPLETNVVSSLAQAYFNTEGKAEQEITYNAQKTHDLRTWVMNHRPDEDYWKDAQADEKDLDAGAQIGELKQDEASDIKDLIDQGYRTDSPEVKEVKEAYKKQSSKEGLQREFWRQRAEYWQQKADELQRQPHPPKEIDLQNHPGLPSPNPQA